ncbi:hypothetical protein NP233_g9242 [Leucocoprinus birnbaumii]|uniref:SLC26A/SulP transporter domain-containing protein n=1 Tax=Leucocoprinus birnbaumii TaxID=56174 RepID=A0AAD5VMI1_9AGAR|nr:hypothetical protein NP233_g9242 [Leucocoprinus birnbaumii]
MVPTSLKTASKKVVNYPENDVDIISPRDWLSGFWIRPLPRIKGYLLSVFPILSWIHRYNVGWLTGDIIAGLTVGIVAVPQGMSYAQIATLPPEGLRNTRTRARTLPLRTRTLPLHYRYAPATLPLRTRYGLAPKMLTER